MQLIIKVLKGEECRVDVQETTTIQQIKQNIELLTNIPIAHQKLVHNGRTLADDKTIAFYSTVKDGAKLLLVVKKPESLNDIMLRYFKKYYDEPQSKRLTREFMLDFETKLKQYSLDDIERVAAACLTQEMK